MAASMEKATDVDYQSLEDGDISCTGSSSNYQTGFESFFDEVQSAKGKDSFRRSIVPNKKNAKDLVELLMADDDGGDDVVNRSNDKLLPCSSDDSASAEMPEICWSDIAGLDDTKELIMAAIIQPLNNQPRLTKPRVPCKRTLLYGPRGSGKSYLAKAIAAEIKGSRCSFILRSCSGMMLNPFGQNEKIDRIIAEAAEHPPSIIFLDDIDWLFREDEVDHANRSLVKRLITETGICNNPESQTGIRVFGATNKPWLLDVAFRRLFDKMFYVPLPELPARISMFRSKVGSTSNSLTKEEFEELAWRSEGYSAKDIVAVANEASMQSVQRIQTATHFKRVSGHTRTNPDLLAPCSPTFPGAIKMSWMDIDGDKLQGPVVSMEDMISVMNSFVSTVSMEDLQRLERFTDDWESEINQQKESSGCLCQVI